MPAFNFTRAPYLLRDHFHFVAPELSRARDVLKEVGDKGRLYVHLNESTEGKPIREVIQAILDKGYNTTYDDLWVLCSTLHIYRYGPQTILDDNSDRVERALHELYMASAQTMTKWFEMTVTLYPNL